MSSPQYQQPQYQQAQYQQPAQPYAQPPQTNILAILSLISAFVLPFVVPIVLGHIALSQIKRSGENGRGLALAGVIIGYVELGLLILWLVAILGFIAFAGASGAFSSTY